MRTCHAHVLVKALRSIKACTCSSTNILDV